MGILKKIECPADLREVDSFEALATEIREKIIETVSENGGHLASNLGVVELTIALLYVFGSKDDVIVWDVGHQCYAHKILTGRKELFGRIRQSEGFSGFLNPEESVYDKFKTGHAGVAVSSASGLLRAKKILGTSGKAIAVVGDGALTCGLTYEGLNNAGIDGSNLLVVLNDNKMSISENVGAISRHLAKIRTFTAYINSKENTKKFLNHVPLGRFFTEILAKFKNVVKSSIAEKTIFENMGFAYFGPFDGHNTRDLIKIFERIDRIEKPVLVHVITKKGKGYEKSEKKPDIFHSVNKFDIKSGEILSPVNETFSDVFGDEICSIAERNNRIFAITAAMPDGVCLKKFSEKFPRSFADVGIAESHAVTFSSGLSKGGMIPIFAVYSSFLQRCVDQIIHDIAMQDAKVVFAIDRAGFVGADGESHQGIFDISLINCFVNSGIKIYSPSYFDELRLMLNLAIENDGISFVRYPKGSEFYKPSWVKTMKNSFDFYGDLNNNDMLVITYGRIFSFAAQAFEFFEEKICLVKLNIMGSFDEDLIKLSKKFKNILFFEEALKSGGIGEKFTCELAIHGFSGKISITAINKDFVKQASVAEQLSRFSLDFEGFKQKIKLSM